MEDGPPGALFQPQRTGFVKEIDVLYCKDRLNHPSLLIVGHWLSCTGASETYNQHLLFFGLYVALTATARSSSDFHYS